MKRKKEMADFYQTALNSAAQHLLTVSPKSVRTRASKIVYENCANFSGPILCSYVIWLLKSSEKKGIKHLYFLARDAKILYQIAQIYIHIYGLPIQCHYLYCSRLALRKTLYYLDKEEALEKLCCNGLQVTPCVIMQRTGLSSNIISEILNDIGVTEQEEHICLSNRGLNIFRQRLSQSQLFDHYMMRNSKQCFEGTISYFKDMGLLQNTKWALVDSGWTGSMQRNIRQILQKINPSISLQGFYFGIFNPTATEDGIYNTFYFSAYTNIWNSILFNHNLFECWCLAGHGMTTGYFIDNTGSYVPERKAHKVTWFEKKQFIIHVHFAKILSHYMDWDKLVPDVLEKTIRRKVIISSIFPSAPVAKLYGSIPFCDDSSESYAQPLAAQSSFCSLLHNLIFVRLYTKFFRIEKSRNIPESFWPEATIRFLPFTERWLLRFDKSLEYILKAFRKVFIMGRHYLFRRI